MDELFGWDEHVEYELGSDRSGLTSEDADMDTHMWDWEEDEEDND